eukprot:352204-Chlamydomonas_euryale.AAC.11
MHAAAAAMRAIRCIVGAWRTPDGVGKAAPGTGDKLACVPSRPGCVARQPQPQDALRLRPPCAHPAFLDLPHGLANIFSELRRKHGV